MTVRLRTKEPTRREQKRLRGENGKRKKGPGSNAHLDAFHHSERGDTQECVRAAGQTGCVSARVIRANDGARHLGRAILIRDYYRFVVIRDNVIIAIRGYSFLVRPGR